MTCLKALRDAARVEVNLDKRAVLHGAAGTLAYYTDKFCKDQNADNLTSLNGAWAHAARVLATVTPPVDPTPPLAPAVNQRRVA